MGISQQIKSPAKISLNFPEILHHLFEDVDLIARLLPNGYRVSWVKHDGWR